MTKVKFYRQDEYLCGDGCCTLFGDTDELVTTREVTDEQLAKLEEGGRGRYTDDYDIEGESERFDYFVILDD